jgi:gamma-glutamyltranspeptidase/glutathione hydrolase
MIHASCLVSLILLVALCAPGAGAQSSDSAAAALVVPGRLVVSSRFGIVATSHPLVSAVGVSILERGGNAVDAAIAANATLGLMEPMNNGMGGDLFAIVYEAKTGKLYGLNASGWAPTGLTPELLASKGLKRVPRRGIYSVTVPGTVAGWDALRERFGTMGFDELLAPAIYYAKSGFPVTEVTARMWKESERTLSATPNAKSTFLIDGRAPREGEIFRNPDLAATLERIARHGRDGFYTGPTADSILALSKAEGGTFTARDLSDFRAEWVEPLHTTYHGWTVYELPPNGQGVAALEMLNIMERFPLAQYGFHSPKAMHVMIEAKKLAYADLLRYVGDPRFSKIPVEQMISKATGEARAKLIDESKAQCHVEPSKFNVLTKAASETIYMSVIDKDGNIVSLIQSNFSWFGSGLVAPPTGFPLQNRGSLFTLEPGQPNTLAPRHRSLHTIIPAFMEKDGTRIGFGIMGGFNQAQAHAQFVADIADYGLSIQQALEAGRFTKLDFDGCDVQIESRVPAATIAALRALGHEVKVEGPRTDTFGFGQAVESTPDGVHHGASDPRHDGAAIPQSAPFGKP